MKDIIGKNLLDVLARVVLYSRTHSDFSLVSAEFVGGVYVVRVLGTEILKKPFVENIVGEHMLCKTLVESVLESDPSTRDDDMLLILGVWALQGIRVNLDAVELETMFNSESIRRSRQKVQNTEGRFLPTTFAVAKRRRINEQLLREHYGKGDLCEKYC